FELLSEDGRSTRCIESVLELSKRRNFRVLVRETVRCNHNSKSLHAGEILTTISDNGKYLQCKTSKDEVVNLPLEAKAKFSPIAKEDSISGVHTVNNLLQKRMPVTVRLVHGTAPKGLKQPFVPELRLLGCVEVDRIFALPLQKDMDLIAVPLNAKIKIQRVKNMDQLNHFIEYSRFLDKAQRLLVDARDRLQIIDLKLGEKEKKDSSKHPEKKLNSTLSSLTANGYVLKKSSSCDSNRYSPPPSAAQPGGGSGSSQNESIADEYDEIDQIYDYVRGLAPLPKNLSKFEAIVEPPSPPITHQHNLKTVENMKPANNSNNNNNNNNSYYSNHYDTGNYSNLINRSSSIMNGNSLESTKQSSAAAAAANAINNNHIHVGHGGGGSKDIDHTKPIPPPIETIPGKKLPEKRQRPTLPKLYFKNSLGMVHQKSPTMATVGSPIGGGTNGPVPALNIVGTPKEIIVEPQSPLFHIRYKSLSSLQLAQDSHPATPISPSPKGGTQEKNHALSKSASMGQPGGMVVVGREGTLDSSRSGGRTSGDSKLPEKKTRRLSRPRSLSNLVWDLRPHKSDKSKKKLYLHQFDRQQGTLYL
ncbi:homeobox protein 5, partial [Uranotaenia lowii]|uniref:homeobox protein 5 n=1 Tax=Uranotaenia lowii TaxID=190385 RepID=UPI0024790183